MSTNTDSARMRSRLAACFRLRQTPVEIAGRRFVITEVGNMDDLLDNLIAAQ